MLLGEKKKELSAWVKAASFSTCQQMGIASYTFHHSCSHSTGFSLLQYLAKILKSAGIPGKVPSKNVLSKPQVSVH